MLLLVVVVVMVLPGDAWQVVTPSARQKGVYLSRKVSQCWGQAGGARPLECRSGGVGENLMHTKRQQQAVNAKTTGVQ